MTTTIQLNPIQTYISALLLLSLSLFHSNKVTTFAFTTSTSTNSLHISSAFASKSTTCLFDAQSESTNIRFLGKGDRAVIRPGVVLIAPNHEYNHFLMKSAVFLHGIGVNDFGEHVTRGVIIDQPTAFTMGEMSGGSVVGSLGQNLLFQGGDMGNDAAMLLHSCDTVGNAIGTSGIYEGGLQSAMELVNDDLLDSDQFKFFFNYVEFTDVELQSMLSCEDSEGDAWTSVEVPTNVILDNDYSRGEAWMSLRRLARQNIA